MKQFIPVSNSEMEPHYECELCESQGQANCIFSHLLGQYPKRWLNRHPVTASAFGIFILTHGGDQYPTVPPERDLFLCSTRKKKKYSRRSQCTFHFNLKKCSFFPPIRGYDKEITYSSKYGSFFLFLIIIWGIGMIFRLRYFLISCAFIKFSLAFFLDFFLFF